MAKTNAQVVAANGDILRPTPAGELPLPLEGVITVELRTGRVVEMVVAELEALQEIGEIPNELAGLVARELYAPVKDEGEYIQRGRERYKIAKWLVAHVLRGPTKFAELFRSEIWEIYNMCQEPARALDNFRKFQARHVGRLSALPEMASDTESVS